MMNQIYTIFSLLLLVCINSYGQESKKWTLEECMAYAVENSPRTNKQIAQNIIHQQDYIEAIGRLLPNIGAGTSAEYNYGRIVDEETNTYTNANSFSNYYSLYSSITLFDGLSSINRIRMQKANKLMGKEQLQSTKDMVAYETMESFFLVLYSAEIVKLAEQQLEESSANHRQVKRMEELGVKGASDVAEMAAKEAADNYNLTRQRNIHTINLIKLKEKMNYPIDEELGIAHSYSNNSVIRSTEHASQIFEYAKEYNPKAVAAELALRSQELNLKAAKGAYLPTITAEGGYYTSFSKYLDGSAFIPFSEQLKGKRRQYFGFSLSVPIFSRFSRSATVNRSKAQVVIAQNEEAEALRSLYSEIEQAVADKNGQADEYNQAQKQSESMSIAHKVNQRKYEEGLISALELHTSSNRLVQAMAEEMNSKLKYELKLRLVEYYKGVPFISENRRQTE